MWINEAADRIRTHRDASDAAPAEPSSLPCQVNAGTKVMSKLATGWRHRTSEASPDPIAAITSRANRTKKRRRQAWAFAGIMLVASWGICGSAQETPDGHSAHH